MVIRTDRSEAALPPSQCLHCQTILSTPGVPGSGLQPAMVTCTTFCTTCHDQYRQKMRAIDRLGTDPLKRKWGFRVDWDVVMRCHRGRKRQRQCLGGGGKRQLSLGAHRSSNPCRLTAPCFVNGQPTAACTADRANSDVHSNPTINASKCIPQFGTIMRLRLPNGLFGYPSPWVPDLSHILHGV